MTDRVIPSQLKNTEANRSLDFAAGMGVRPLGLARQTWFLLKHGLATERADAERLISPLLFSVTLLVLFAFAVGDIDPSLRQRLYLAEVFLTGFFALQVAFQRLFDPDRQDRVFDVLRSYPVSPLAYFVSKYALVLLQGTGVLLPTLVVGAFLNQSQGLSLWSWFLVLVSLLALIGLGALGVLLSTLTLGARARQILYPLLYFPLTAPVLLAAVQSSTLFLENGQSLTPPVRAWLGLLLAFDTIYVTLGVLLFPELLDDA